jgi:hypothetical protein
MPIIIPHVHNPQYAFRIGGSEGDTHGQPVNHYNCKFVSSSCIFPTYGDGLTAHGPPYQIQITEYANFCESVCKFIAQKNDIKLAMEIANPFCFRTLELDKWEKMLRYVDSYKDGGKVPYFNKSHQQCSTAEKLQWDSRWICGKHLKNDVSSFIEFFQIPILMLDYLIHSVEQFPGSKDIFYESLYPQLKNNIDLNNHFKIWTNRFHHIINHFHSLERILSRDDFKNL